MYAQVSIVSPTQVENPEHVKSRHLQSRPDVFSRFSLSVISFKAIREVLDLANSAVLGGASRLTVTALQPESGHQKRAKPQGPIVSVGCSLPTTPCPLADVITGLSSFTEQLFCC